MRTRENPLFDPGMHGRGPVAPDRVNETAPDVAQALLNHPPQPVVVFDPDVLEHSNRYECVVLAGDVPIIVLDELNAGAEPLAVGPLAGKRNLRARDVESAHLDAVVLRHVDRETSPPAAVLDDAFTGPQPHLAADVIHLGHLRLIQR